MGHGGHRRPDRPGGAGHRGQQRHRLRDGAGAGRPRGPRDPGLPQRGEGAPGARQAGERARPLPPSSCSTSTWPTWSRCAAPPTRFSPTHARLDLLVNNAGVMGTPYRQTADGFELQMATNHLGPLRADRPAARPDRHHRALADRHRQLPHAPRRPAAASTTSPAPAQRNTWVSYGTSKLANLLFTAELSRRLEAAGLPTLALAAHPGWTRSNLAGNGAALGDSRVRRQLGRTAGTTLGQSTAAGALPVLCAATSSVGPVGAVRRARRGSFGLFGPPRVVAAVGTRPRRRGWRPGCGRASEELTGVRYSVAAPRLNAAAAPERRLRHRPAARRLRPAGAAQERGVARRTIGPEHAAQGHDHDGARTGAAQRGRCTLGPCAADVGVVEQHDATAADASGAAAARRPRKRGASGRMWPTGASERASTSGDQPAPGRAAPTSRPDPSTPPSGVLRAVAPSTGPGAPVRAGRRPPRRDSARGPRGRRRTGRATIGAKRRRASPTGDSL